MPMQTDIMEKGLAKDDALHRIDLMMIELAQLENRIIRETESQIDRLCGEYRRSITDAGVGLLVTGEVIDRIGKVPAMPENGKADSRIRWKNTPADRLPSSRRKVVLD